MTPDVHHHALVDRVPRAVGRVVVDVGELLLAPLRMPERNPALVGVAAYAREEMERMRRQPVRVARPVVLLNGYHAWHGVVASLQRTLVKLVSQREADFFDVSYATMTDFAAVRRHVIDEIVRVHGLETEVDLVGISMGGLVSRMIACEWPGDARRVRVHRIFTIASPHVGARLARRVHVDAAARDMIAGSEMLQRLNCQTHPRLRCYAQLNDTIVGATNTAPPGIRPFWSAGTAIMSHFTTIRNPLILADIARCLRNEPPLLQTQAASRPVCD